MIAKSESMGCTIYPMYPDTYPNWPLPNTYPSPNTSGGYITYTQTKEVPVQIELYQENLKTILAVLTHLDNIAIEEGVFSVEIRVKVDDIATWAVLGYGESGDPCVLRFEKD